MGEEFDHERLSDTQDAFLTRLRRSSILLNKLTDNMRDRTELLRPILPHLPPEHREKMEHNIKEYALLLGDLGEVQMLLGEDLGQVGDTIGEFVVYLQEKIDEWENKKEGE